MLESADLRKSWTVRPSYSYHFELAPCFILPSPQATQARIHSRFQFVMSKTGPCLRKTLLSIFCNSESRGRVMGSSFAGTAQQHNAIRFTCVLFDINAMLPPVYLRGSCRTPRTPRTPSHFGTLGHPSAKYPLKGRYSQQ